MIKRPIVSIATSAGIALSVLALTITVRPLMLEAQQQAAVRVPRSVLERYVGEYLYPDGAPFKVGLEGDTLLQETPGRRVPYAAISETLFMLGPVFTAEFVIDRAGGVTQILSDGAGVEYRLRRKGSPPEPPAASPAAVRVPRSVLERYVGVYEYIPGQMQRTDLRIVVGLRGDTLTRQMGQEAVLTPISETRFKVGNTSLMVEFVVDEAGVTQVLGSGFQQMLARRTSKR
ncbi:MAG: hypothetical protein M3468_15045 [Acidobacteriota bacterium]|nr:hypothetical protein [Acidobacteriota bacterium]MDQ3489031.1 hypothetical protein [Acidobacteriota bacterium]